MKIGYIKLLFFVLTLSSCNSNFQKENIQDNKPYVVMLSMDGFRWDYPDKANTPNLDNIEKIGVKAQASIPCFPTKTFPNHYSMATGLYPENHGIIFNNFFATDIEKYYSLSNMEAVTDPEFYFGEPIWVTAEKQGVKSASYFWVGADAPHDSIFPTYHYTYDGSVPFEERIDGVIDWLKLPEEKRPHLIMWYIQEPDSKGHDVGPNHPETIETVEYLDSLVGVFYAKINALTISDEINVIITSDHGMGEISDQRVIYLDHYIPKEWCHNIDGNNPVYSLDIKDEYYDTAYSILSSLQHMKVWKKDQVPDRLHFSNSDRIKGFVIVADSSWSLLKSNKRKFYSGGTHGYDNQNTDMHAIFYAYGPDFKSNYKHPAINNIDIFPLICKLLKIEGPEVDGKIEKTIEMLKK